jgi:hypothetical protein
MARRLIIGVAAILLAGGGVAIAGMDSPPGVVAVLLPQPRDAGGSLIATPADLSTRIAQAQAGDTIRLQPGDYGFTVIQRKIDGAPVRLIGPRSARISGLAINGGAGWHFTGMTFVPFQKRPPIVLGGARDVLFDDVLITGTAPGDGPEQEEGSGMQLDDSEGLVLINSELSHLRICMGLRGVRGMVIAGNRLVNNREGININGSRGLLITRNLFQGFKPRFDKGEHPDFIQLFTRQRPGSGQMEISGNFFNSGLAQAVQGIFARAEDFETGSQPDGFHRDITIRNNLYYGSSAHGISLSNARNVVIERNTVLPSPNAFVGHLKPPDPTGQSSGGFQPRIALSGASTGRIVGNVSPRMLIDEKNAVVTLVDNVEIAMRAPGDALNPGGLFAQPLGAGEYPPAQFALRPRSSAARRGVGADVAQVGVPAGGFVAADMLARSRALLASTPPLPERPRAGLATRLMARIRREWAGLAA